MRSAVSRLPSPSGLPRGGTAHADQRAERRDHDHKGKHTPSAAMELVPSAPGRLPMKMRSTIL